MGNIIQVDELQNILNDKQTSKKVLLIDGQMPAVKEGQGYFYYSDDLKDFDAAPFCGSCTRRQYGLLVWQKGGCTTP